MSMADGQGHANDAGVDIDQVRHKGGEDAVRSRLEYLQRVVDATAQGVKGAERKIDRAEQDLQGAHEAYDQAEAQHAQALGELQAFKTAAGVE